ncbi:MAG: TlpA family protein disulfide reductase [Candidatus Thermoplasmatota archaeon]|nr:TlpA family protein disulfide reductase [Candidatus Thermoplasmatota archaeon]
MKKAALIAIVLLASGLTLLFLIEEPAPDFTGADAYGQNFTLSEQRGTVVILNFMFTTCKACEQEIEVLKDIRGVHSESDLVIVSISVSLSDNNEILRTFRESKGANWTFLMDPGGVTDSYGVRSVPHMFVIDGSGRIASSHADVLGAEGVSSLIDNARSQVDPIVMIILSVALIGVSLGILFYLGYTKRDMIKERLVGGSGES